MTKKDSVMWNRVGVKYDSVWPAPAPNIRCPFFVHHIHPPLLPSTTSYLPTTTTTSTSTSSLLLHQPPTSSSWPSTAAASMTTTPTTTTMTSTTTPRHPPSTTDPTPRHPRLWLVILLYYYTRGLAPSSIYSTSTYFTCSLPYPLDFYILHFYVQYLYIPHTSPAVLLRLLGLPPATSSMSNLKTIQWLWVNFNDP